jgi:hypothetical protein
MLHLPSNPGDYDKVASVANLPAEAANYLLVRNGDCIEYFRVNDQIVEKVRDVVKVQGSVQALSMSARTVKELVDVGALRLVS